MRNAVMIGAFALLIIGTAGLLINEFVSGWGRTASITFAVVNVFGLTLLAYTSWGMRLYEP